MAKRKRQANTTQRPFRPEVLLPHVSKKLRAALGSGAHVWRFTIVIPIEEIRPKSRRVATDRDLQTLEIVLPEHFGGLTVLPPSTGYGPRCPTDPAEEPQLNYNAFFVVYAARGQASQNYFQALQHELASALNEGLILIERQEVVLL